MRDLHNNVSPAVALMAQAIGTDTTTAGAIVDLQGFEGCEFVILSGTVTDGTYTPLIEHGDDSGLSDAAAVPDSGLLGTEAAAAFAAADDDAVKRVGYVDGKRYVRLSLVSAGTATGVNFMAAVAVRSHPRHAPTS